MAVVMQAPAGISTIAIIGGLTYTPNAAGQINAQNADVAALIALGFTAVSGPGNYFANFRNLIDGGDFTTNSWQRNIPGLASGGVISTPIAGTVTYFPDRFFAVGSAGSAILMAQVADTSVPGFSQSLKVSRQSGNANTATINFGQVVETADSIRAQGQVAVLSFWAKQGANYSGGALTAQVVSGTTTPNQSAAALANAAWTGESVFINGSQTLTTGMTRYSFQGNVPLNAIQLGVLFSWAGSAVASGADDSISFHGIQLELGGLSAFEHRDIQVELEMAQRYAWVIPEPGTGVIVGAGMNTGASAQVYYLATPVQLRAAPTVSVSPGTFKSNQAGVVTAATITAGATHTPNAISINSAASGMAGQGTLLQGGGGTGYIIASADL